MAMFMQSSRVKRVWERDAIEENSIIKRIIPKRFIKPPIVYKKYLTVEFAENHYILYF